jgi:hypothetical protein
VSASRFGSVAATAVVLVAATVLTACSGSHDSSGRDFAAAVRAVCTKYAAQEAAVSRRLGKSSAPNQRLIRETFRISDRYLGDLRELSPPASTGVSAVEWRKVLDAVRRDGRAFDSFYVKEYPKLLRSFKESNPEPKLPPGTGATAAILAQAFNSGGPPLSSCAATTRAAASSGFEDDGAHRPKGRHAEGMR